MVASVIFPRPLTFCLHSQNSLCAFEIVENVEENPREDFFIKGELIFQWYFYLYVFISTAFRKCSLEPPWKKLKAIGLHKKAKIQSEMWYKELTNKQ